MASCALFPGDASTSRSVTSARTLLWQAAHPVTRMFSPLACSALRATGWVDADAIGRQKLHVQQNPENAQKQGDSRIGSLDRGEEIPRSRKPAHAAPTSPENARCLEKPTNSKTK